MKRLTQRRQTTFQVTLQFYGRHMQLQNIWAVFRFHVIRRQKNCIVWSGQIAAVRRRKLLFQACHRADPLATLFIVNRPCVAWISLIQYWFFSLPTGSAPSWFFPFRRGVHNCQSFLCFATIRRLRPGLTSTLQGVDTFEAPSKHLVRKLQDSFISQNCNNFFLETKSIKFNDMFKALCLMFSVLHNT